MTKFDTLLCSKRNYWSGPIFKKQNKKKLVCSLDFCFSLVFVRMEGKKKFCKISIWSKFMKFSFGWRGRKWVLSSNIIDFLRWRESFSAFIQRVKYFFFSSSLSYCTLSLFVQAGKNINFHCVHGDRWMCF